MDYYGPAQAGDIRESYPLNGDDRDVIPTTTFII
jgi:hypothetical protein